MKIIKFLYILKDLFSTITQKVRPWILSIGARLINSRVYTLYSIFVYLVSLIETYKYPGFVGKHFMISSIIFYILYVAFSLSILIKQLRHKKTTRFIIQESFLVTIIVMAFLLIAFLFLNIIEEAHYSNYVFSNFHINLNGLNYLLTLVLFSITYKMLRFLNTKIAVKNDNKYLINRIIIPYLFISIFIPTFFVRYFEVLALVINNSSLTISSLGTKYSDRFIIKTKRGPISWVYQFSQFVTKHTNPKSTIFIPPQIDSWELTGNLHYMQSMLYPRKLVQDPVNIYSPIPEGTDYVMVAFGEWKGTNKVWPRIAISKSNIDTITIIDRYSLDETVLEDSYYAPDLKEEKWGIIKLKK